MEVKSWVRPGKQSCAERYSTRIKLILTPPISSNFITSNIVKHSFKAIICAFLKSYVKPTINHTYRGTASMFKARDSKARSLCSSHLHPKLSLAKLNSYTSQSASLVHKLLMHLHRTSRFLA